MDAHAHAGNLPHEHVTPIGLYVAIFAGLMVLTVVTVAVAWMDLGNLNILVALAVAVVKATLVVLFFMHLKYSTRLTWVVVGAGFFWLGILLAITLSDYLTRGWIMAPGLVR